MRILVICGAGASSTFVAQRVRAAAQARGLAYTAVAGTEQSLPFDIATADVVLVGPHLAHAMPGIQREGEARGVAVALLPTDVFGDLDGSRTLSLVQGLVVTTSPTTDQQPA